jgi:hypothetical protein
MLYIQRKMVHISLNQQRINSMQSIVDKVIARIRGKGTGWVFTHADLADLGGRQTIDWALHSLAGKGTIRRVMRGVYDYPQTGTLIKEHLPVDMPSVAAALARKFGWKIAPSGETALNILGITNQVPASYTFISTGRSKEYKVGNRQLVFKKGMLKEADFTHAESTLLVQALRALGKGSLSHDQLERLRAAVPRGKRQRIIRDTRSVTGWVHAQIRRICSGDD